MAHNTRIRGGGLWTLNSVITPAEMESFDLAQFQSINGDLGGVWAPAAVIEIAGLGLKVDGAPFSALTSVATFSGASFTVTNNDVTFGGTGDFEVNVNGDAEIQGTDVLLNASGGKLDIQCNGGTGLDVEVLGVPTVFDTEGVTWTANTSAKVFLIDNFQDFDVTTDTVDIQSTVGDLDLDAFLDLRLNGGVDVESFAVVDYKATAITGIVSIGAVLGTSLLFGVGVTVDAGAGTLNLDGTTVVLDAATVVNIESPSVNSTATAWSFAGTGVVEFASSHSRVDFDCETRLNTDAKFYSRLHSQNAGHLGLTYLALADTASQTVAVTDGQFFRMTTISQTSTVDLTTGSPGDHCWIRCDDTGFDMPIRRASDSSSINTLRSGSATQPTWALYVVDDGGVWQEMASGDKTA